MSKEIILPTYSPDVFSAVFDILDNKKCVTCVVYHVPIIKIKLCSFEFLGMAKMSQRIVPLANIRWPGR